MNLVFLLIFIGVCAYVLYSVKSLFDESNESQQIIKKLIRGCSRWAIASKQDKNPLIGMLHANYAAGYLWALKDVFSDTQIERVTGISNIIDLQNDIINIQDFAANNLIDSCKIDITSSLNHDLSKLSRSNFN